MKETTLCYLEHDGCYLMLYRNKKESDPNEGKWLGVGGKIEPGETPAQCVLREIREETGLCISHCESRGVIDFVSDTFSERMHLFTGAADTAQVIQCSEGTLQWIPKERILELPLWEGDRFFLQKLLDGEQEIRMTLYYQGETLIKACENDGKERELL